jgi:hypothetical protein
VLAELLVRQEETELPREGPTVGRQEPFPERQRALLSNGGADTRPGARVQRRVQRLVHHTRLYNIHRSAT